MYYKFSYMSLCKICGDVFNFHQFYENHIYIECKEDVSSSHQEFSSIASPLTQRTKRKFEPCYKCRGGIFVGDKFVIVQKPSIWLMNCWQKEFRELYGHRICLKCCKILPQPKMQFETFELGIAQKNTVNVQIRSQPILIPKKQTTQLRAPIACMNFVNQGIYR